MLDVSQGSWSQASVLAAMSEPGEFKNMRRRVVEPERQHDAHVRSWRKVMGPILRLRRSIAITDEWIRNMRAAGWLP